MKLFINKEPALPYDPLNPSSPYIDSNLRAKTPGRPGIPDKDVPQIEDQFFDYVANGEDSKQSANPAVDEVVDVLMKDYQEAQSSILKKIYYYPESLGNITTKSYVDGHEVPRNILKITILDYAGGNLVSKEAKQKIENFTEKVLGSGQFSGSGTLDKLSSAVNEFSDIANEVLLNNPNLYSSEINNYQDKVNQMASSGFGNLINQAQKEGGLNEARNQFREQAQKILSSNIGKELSTKYLTSPDYDSAVKNLTDYVSSRTTVNTKLLPDEVKNIIYLYATGDNLNYSYSTNWGAKEQGGLFPALQNILANQAAGGSIADAMKDAAKSIAGEVLKGGMENKMFAPLVQAAAAKVGMAPAQNYEFLFESVGRRSFSVQVAFYPKSQEEIRQVAKIISAIKYYSHPSRENRSALVKVPCVFLLENMTYVDGRGWIENLYLPKYKICALLNTNVNYSQNGVLITHQEFSNTENGPTFKAPIKITLGMNFQEMQILTREDIPKPDDFFDANIQKNGYY